MRTLSESEKIFTLFQNSVKQADCLKIHSLEQRLIEKNEPVPVGGCLESRNTWWILSVGQGSDTKGKPVTEKEISWFL